MKNCEGSKVQSLHMKKPILIAILGPGMAAVVTVRW